MQIRTTRLRLENFGHMCCARPDQSREHLTDSAPLRLSGARRSGLRLC